MIACCMPSCLNLNHYCAKCNASVGHYENKCCKWFFHPRYLTKFQKKISLKRVNFYKLSNRLSLKEDNRLRREKRIIHHGEIWESKSITYSSSFFAFCLFPCRMSFNFGNLLSIGMNLDEIFLKWLEKIDTYSYLENIYFVFAVNSLVNLFIYRFCSYLRWFILLDPAFNRKRCCFYIFCRKDGNND